MNRIFEHFILEMFHMFGSFGKSIILLLLLLFTHILPSSLLALILILSDTNIVLHVWFCSCKYLLTFNSIICSMVLIWKFTLNLLILLIMFLFSESIYVFYHILLCLLSCSYLRVTNQFIIQVTVFLELPIFRSRAIK